MVRRPIDSFVKYFLDIKPYHTKILEVVERYLFSEEIQVSIKENYSLFETLANDPLCRGVGYGLDFDDECGFSASSCCDLFTCLGGYGLIFDNSDLLMSAPVTSFDRNLGSITVSGDRRFDTYLRIESISSNNILKIRGNVTSIVSPHHLFVIAPINTYDVTETVSDGFYVSGNVRAQFLGVNEFEVLYSTANDDTYSVLNAIYRADQNRTYIKVFKPNLSTDDQTDTVSLDINSLGKIIIKSSTKNNGAYQRTDAFFDGTFTNIVLSSETPLLLPSEQSHGSIVLRTGLIPGRHVWLNDGTGFPAIPTISESKVLSRTYDPLSDSTTILLEIANSSVYDTLTGTFDSSAQLDLSAIISVDLRGYYFGAGFDGLRECSIPKPPNIHTTFSEFLSIEVVLYEGMRTTSGGGVRVTTDGDPRII